MTEPLETSPSAIPDTPTTVPPPKKSKLGLWGYLGIGCGVLVMAGLCVLVILLLVSNRTPAKNEKSMETFAVDASGGKFESKDLAITVPAGAAGRKLAFDVVQLDTPAAGEPGSSYHSAKYTISGPLEALNGDIEISLAVPASALAQKEKTLTVVMEEDVFSRGAGETSAFYLLPSSVDTSLKRVSAILSLTGQDAVGFIPGGKNGQAAPLAGWHWQAEANQALTVSVETGWFYDTASSEHFRVSYRGRVLDEASVKEFVGILEEQRSNIKSFGFSFGSVKKTDILLEVLNQETGEFDPSQRGGDYCTIKIASKFFYTRDLFEANRDLVRASAGHELLHLAEFMMDPRYAYTKSKKEGAKKTLWMDEAASTWFETQASGNPGYVSDNAGKNRFFFQTALMSPPINNAQDHGYGASIFLQYLVGKFGEHFVPEVYQELHKGTSSGTAAQALVRALDAHNSSPGIEWTPFLETYFSNPGSIYSGLEAPDVSKTLTLVGSPVAGQNDYSVFFRSNPNLVKNRKSEAPGTLSAGPPASITFTFQQAGLTADMFYLYMPQQGPAGAPFSVPGMLTVAVDAPEYGGVLVYGIPAGGGRPVPLAGAPYNYLSSGDPVSQFGSRLLVNVNGPDSNGNTYEKILFIPFNNHSEFLTPEVQLPVTLQLTYMLPEAAQPPRVEPTTTKTKPPKPPKPKIAPSKTVQPGSGSSHVCAGMTVSKLRSPLNHTTKCWLTCFQIQGASPSDGEIQACINRFQ